MRDLNSHAHFWTAVFKTAAIPIMRIFHYLAGGLGFKPRSRGFGGRNNAIILSPYLFGASSQTQTDHCRLEGEHAIANTMKALFGCGVQELHLGSSAYETDEILLL